MILIENKHFEFFSFVFVILKTLSKFLTARVNSEGKIKKCLLPIDPPLTIT